MNTLLSTFQNQTMQLNIVDWQTVPSVLFTNQSFAFCATGFLTLLGVEYLATLSETAQKEEDSWKPHPMLRRSMRGSQFYALD